MSEGRSLTSEELMRAIVELENMPTSGTIRFPRCPHCHTLYNIVEHPEQCAANPANR